MNEAVHVSLSGKFCSDPKWYVCIVWFFYVNITQAAFAVPDHIIKNYCADKPEVRAARPAQEGEVLIATQNAYRFFDTEQTSREEPVVGTVDFKKRVSLFSTYIENQLQLPDVLALQEVESIEVLEAIAKQLLSDTQKQYQSVLLGGHDYHGLDVGYLISSDLVVRSAYQIGQQERLLMDDSWLYDRPPLVLELSHKNTELSFSIVNIHLRSMIGIQHKTKSKRVKQKRLEQAQWLARWLQEKQGVAPVLVLGDFNGRFVSDDYVDVIGVISGTNKQQAEYTSKDLVDPDYWNVVDAIKSSERVSYVYRCRSYVLDHALLSAQLKPRFVESMFVMGLAGSKDKGRLSDHNGLVVYLK